jgi:hypothetical protein
MSRTTRIAIVAIWILSLAIVGVTAARAGQLQLQRPSPVGPTVVSGADFGFRITGVRGDHAVGTIVVRQNGEWVEADLAGGVRQLSLK